MNAQYYHLEHYYGRDSVRRAERPDRTAENEQAYERWRADVGLTARTQAAAKAENYRADAQYYRNDMYYRNEQVNSYAVEWHKKFSLSAACLVLFFIGAPLGSIIRKGAWACRSSFRCCCSSSITC